VEDGTPGRQTGQQRYQPVWQHVFGRWHARLRPRDVAGERRIALSGHPVDPAVEAFERLAQRQRRACERGGLLGDADERLADAGELSRKVRRAVGAGRVDHDGVQRRDVEVLDRRCGVHPGISLSNANQLSTKRLECHRAVPVLRRGELSRRRGRMAW
jgi:hypothetical protein